MLEEKGLKENKMREKKGGHFKPLFKMQKSIEKKIIFLIKIPSLLDKNTKRIFFFHKNTFFFGQKYLYRYSYNLGDEEKCPQLFLFESGLFQGYFYKRLFL